MTASIQSYSTFTIHGSFEEITKIAEWVRANASYQSRMTVDSNQDLLCFGDSFYSTLVLRDEYVSDFAKSFSKELTKGHNYYRTDGLELMARIGCAK